MSFWHRRVSPLLRLLDARVPGRALRPADPVLALVDAILEDWADEWLTKAMFHYRWAFEEDARHAASILPRWSMTEREESECVARGAFFADRQVGRLGVVGSSAATASFLEDSYVRALALLDAALSDSRFLLGRRPAPCDLAVYGQLTQLVGFDPTSSRIARAKAPRVVAWVDIVDELSGLEPREEDWTRAEDLPASIRALLAEVGRVYAPFLLANAAAVAAGEAEVSCDLDGHRWTQRSFSYQAKCLAWLRQERDALTDADRGRVDALLAGTGCEALFAAR